MYDSYSNNNMSIILHFGVRSGIAVLSHRQPVLADLITDGERRVFRRVPQTRSTMDLRITNNYDTTYYETYHDILRNVPYSYFG